MERPILSARGAAGYLEALDNVLLLTHVRPDGDTIGSAAALCRALRDCGQTAYLLPNPEITATYAPYAAPYWAPEGWQAEHIVSVDIADASLLPALSWLSTTIPPRRFLPATPVWKRTAPPAARSCMRSSSI